MQPTFLLPPLSCLGCAVALQRFPPVLSGIAQKPEQDIGLLSSAQINKNHGHELQKLHEHGLTCMIQPHPSSTASSPSCSGPAKVCCPPLHPSGERHPAAWCPRTHLSCKTESHMSFKPTTCMLHMKVLPAHAKVPRGEILNISRVRVMYVNMSS